MSHTRAAPAPPSRIDSTELVQDHAEVALLCPNHSMKAVWAPAHFIRPLEGFVYGADNSWLTAGRGPHG
jgi:hypothetical protein